MKKSFCTFAAAASALALAACGDEPPTQAEQDAARVQQNANVDVSGEPIEIVGAPAIVPFAEAVAEEFVRYYPNAAAPAIEAAGAHAGLEALCSEGGPDIAASTRRITAEELTTCEANGVADVVELPVGMDAIVLARAASAPDLALTLPQIYTALAAEAVDGGENTADSWNDVDPSLPDAPIRVILPPEGSAARESFAELIMLRGCREIEALAETDEERCTAIRSDAAIVEGSGEDAAVIAQLSETSEAIAALRYGAVANNAEAVKPLPIGGQVPNFDNIASSGYPGARTLYFYVNRARYAEKPALRVFLGEFLKDEVSGPEGSLRERGFVASPPWTRDEAKQANETGKAVRPESLG